MPTASIAGSRLSTLSFIDPQRQPGWRHAVVPAGDPRGLAAAPRPLAVEVAGAGRSHSLEEWRDATWTTSLLVLDGGRLVHEWYADGLGADTLFLGASMTKSVLAHLVGRACTDGALGLDDLVTDHVDELAGTGWSTATVRDVLTMTSGVDWVEDHRDPASAASRLLGCFPDGESRALLLEVRPGAEPGTRWSYCTADSQVLDWVRERATGRSYADDVARLWADLGCTHEAAVAVDGRGVALAGGGLAATTRDWARIALLAVDGTDDRGRRMLDPAWVEAAARPAYPFLAPGRLPSSITTHAGFGLHWWPLDPAGDRLTADGSRGQLAAADRSTGAVVVKTSLWPYDDFLVDRQARDLSYLGLHALLDLFATSDPTP
ncbi:CubicO group peptidase (beta-lactamase class C family) [Nocardioides sp. BE266]|uniref:serine hydrolase domain-containing protein n=1 Tax=Nocardioides sp. BE266 TaxID=2817725 RepID=UPI0028648296|nr:serine hydrolase domain-containing protein [Nocardioides sp. BE266]MDR7251351.1 CubicO group peptidase (beta-lactamase class C family) [Nocardioides sp. BE266]